MNIWNVLGIEKTKDKDAIKEAYRAKLQGVNPEDNQEGFMELRSAFEEAMYEADKKDDETEELIEPGSVLYELKEIYNDFNRRICVDEWRNLFERDEFVALDTAEETMYIFFRFLMDNYFVPQDVYRLICDTFNVVEVKAELCERLPENFVSHIIDNARFRDPINYYLFDGDLDEVEKYIDIYYGLDSAIRRRNVEEEARLIAELEAIDIYHPYLEIAKCRHQIHSINEKVESNEERREKYGDKLHELQLIGEDLLNDFADDYYILLFCGDVAIIRNSLEDAEKYYNSLSQLDPKDVSIKNRLGDLKCAKGEFEEARDLFMKLLDLNQYDEAARYGLVRANNGLIEKYSKILEENPEDEKTKYDIVWCYYRNGDFGKCVEILQEFTPTGDNKCEYYDLLGRNLMYLDRYEEALEALFAWKDSILEIPEDDNSEKAVKNKNRFLYVNYYIGECYINMKNYDEARKFLDIATSKKHEFIEYAYDALCKLEYESGHYDACLKVCEKLLESSISYDAYLYMAKSFYQLDEYGNAVEACNNATRIQSYFYEPYVILLRMYWECQEYEMVDRTLNRFEQYCGYPNDDVDFFKARMAMRREENEKAIELFKGIMDRRGTQEATMSEYDLLNVYTLLASCYERQDDEEKALEYLEKGLESEPGDTFFLNRIGNVCHVLGDFEREISCFDEILGSSEDDDYLERAYKGKAEALCCMKEFDKAKLTFEEYFDKYGYNSWAVIDYAELLVRMNLVNECFDFMRMAYSKTEDQELKRPIMGNLCCLAGNEGHIDVAYEAYKTIVNNHDEEYFIERTIGFVYLDHKMYQEAIEHFKIAIERDTEHESYTCALLLLALKKIDDIYKPEYKKYIDIATEQLEDASDAYTWLKKSEFYRAMDRHEEALELCDLAISEKRRKDATYIENYDAWYEKGLVYYEMEDYENAIKCFEKALSIYGHNQQYIDFVKECKEKL
ncbi:MAG: tetratricopeptide repeat protein [Lachnospiraceae bacterium]|nr:tetratricopeptide repeat protein [Lachnospiraceae bacterium]